MIRRASWFLWVMAGFALEGMWLFAHESFREREPRLLAFLVLVPGLVIAAAWQTLLRLPTRRAAIVGALWLGGALVAFDLLLDLVSPYPRRFVQPGWEAARVASLVAGFGLAASLPGARVTARWFRTTAAAVCVCSVVLAALVPGAMVYIAVDGSRDDTASADAALVLGYALAEDGTAQPQLIGRMEHAVELVQRGVVPRLVLSGGVGKNGHTEAGVMRDLALAAGVSADALVLDEAARSTIENFACSRGLLERMGGTRLLVVTEPWHMTRAMLLARRHGLPAMQSPASSDVWRNPRAAGYWLFRDAVAYLRERARDPFAEPGRCGSPECEGCRTF